VTKEAGVAGPEKLNGWTKWSTNAVFTDYDRDGHLDLWVCNYLAFDAEFDHYYAPEGFPGPLNYVGQPSLLYRNEGDGTFTDVTKKAGVFRKDGRGMGASAGDLNGDGWPDVYEANDAMANYLFLNRGDGTFAEVGEDTLCASGQGGENTAAMHGVLADFDRNGTLDVFVPDMNYFSLYRNDREGTDLIFEDVGNRSGIAKVAGQYVGWGGFFIDYDNDGWQDLFVATGEAHRHELEPNLVLRNLGNGKFEDVSERLGKRVFRDARLSRGAACGDLDGDGDRDVVVVNIDAKLRGDRAGLPTVLVNEGGNANHWLRVRLRGTKSNRDGIGAKIRLTTGDETWFAEVGSSPSYLCSTEAAVHFGLGARETVERLEVTWPSGAVQVLENVAADRRLTITEKGGK